jgi:hypothetical protein|uniref:Uncharacterized protein n=1 Tax=uncultured marine virus TaxID=186617 RepID=A0A0F7L8I2_9VIRU|nr:hypothetical protein [uncultured marine virus]
MTHERLEDLAILVRDGIYADDRQTSAGIDAALAALAELEGGLQNLRCALSFMDGFLSVPPQTRRACGTGAEEEAGIRARLQRALNGEEF